MKYYKQLVKHKPPLSYGDCVRTCVACLLDKSPEEVEHFFATDDATAAWAKMRDWLSNEGYNCILIPATQWTLQEAFIYADHALTNVPYIMFGNSHAVICLNGKIIHDPSWIDIGIKSPDLLMIIIEKHGEF